MTEQGERVLQRILSRTQPSANGCWLYTGYLDKDGYGRSKDLGDRSAPVHRVVYELLRERIPGGLTLDHLCRKRSCVNPAHMEPVTQLVNYRRAVAARQARTHCRNGHEYTDENIYINAKGCRRCRACIRAAAERHYAKRSVMEAV